MNKVWEFTESYLKKCKRMKPQEILSYLEDYKSAVYFSNESKKTFNKKLTKSILISIKIPEDLLSQFKKACEKNGLRYQTQIKVLMKEWMEKKL